MYEKNGAVVSALNAIKEAVITDGVTKIGNEAFYDCSSLAEITFMGKQAPDYQASSDKLLDEIYSISKIIVPVGTLSVYKESSLFSTGRLKLIVESDEPAK